MTEELFETFDLLAQWRLSDSEALGGLAEVQRVGNGQEVSKVA